MPVTISIVTATWNCVSTAEQCLRSVAEQSYRCREHIVIDGGSGDGTVDLLRDHRESLAVLVSEPDHGIYDALNKGIDRSTGDVVGFLHADDIYASSNVLESVAELFEDPTVCAVYGDLQYVRRDDLDHVVRTWTSSPFTNKKLRWGWMPPHPTLYVKRAWYQRIGGFDTRYKIAADYLSVLRLFGEADFVPVYLPQVMVKMRMGGVSNRSLSNVLEKTREDWRALRQTGAGVLGGVGALACKNLSKLTQFRRKGYGLWAE